MIKEKGSASLLAWELSCMPGPVCWWVYFSALQENALSMASISDYTGRWSKQRGRKMTEKWVLAAPFACPTDRAQVSLWTGDMCHVLQDALWPLLQVFWRLSLCRRRTHTRGQEGSTHHCAQMRKALAFWWVNQGRAWGRVYRFQLFQKIVSNSEYHILEGPLRASSSTFPFHRKKKKRSVYRGSPQHQYRLHGLLIKADKCLERNYVRLMPTSCMWAQTSLCASQKFSEMARAKRFLSALKTFYSVTRETTSTH